MRTLTIEIPENYDLDELIAALAQMGIHVNNEKPFQSDESEKRLSLLKRLAANGGVRQIPDPGAWQSEIRSDRPLP